MGNCLIDRQIEEVPDKENNNNKKPRLWRWDRSRNANNWHPGDQFSLSRWGRNGRKWIGARLQGLLC